MLNYVIPLLLDSKAGALGGMFWYMMSKLEVLHFLLACRLSTRLERPSLGFNLCVHFPCLTSQACTKSSNTFMSSSVCVQKELWQMHVVSCLLSGRADACFHICPFGLRAVTDVSDTVSVSVTMSCHQSLSSVAHPIQQQKA